MIQYRSLFLFLFFATIILFPAKQLNAQLPDKQVMKQKGQWLVPSDSLHWNRLLLISGSTAVAFSSALIGLNTLWYADYPRGSFKFIDDSKEWQQMDKTGHFAVPYMQSRYLMKMLQWSGVEHQKAAVYAGVSAFMFQNAIEVLDGYSAQWGASWSDIAANFIGASLMTSQELIWNEQRISLKIMPHFVTYPDDDLKARAQQLYGTSFAARLIKDYNSINMWLSINPASFNRHQKHLKWLNIAVGYGAGGMFGGYENRWEDKNGVPFNRSDIVRYRKLLLSLDVDFSKIKTQSPYGRLLLDLLNLIKVPAPTIEWNSKGQLLFHPLM